MKAMVIDRIASLKDEERPLSAVDLRAPEPAAGAIRIEIVAAVYAAWLDAEAPP